MKDIKEELKATGRVAEATCSDVLMAAFEDLADCHATKCIVIVVKDEGPDDEYFDHYSNTVNEFEELGIMSVIKKLLEDGWSAGIGRDNEE